MKYEIITERSTKMLEQVVGEFIELGWKPLGGVCLDSNDEGELYCQAIILEQEVQNEKANN